MRAIRLSRLFWGMLLLSACNFASDTAVVLPEFDDQTAVEFYIQAGVPFRAAVTVTQGYLAPIELPDVTDATMVVRHNGRSDTLRYDQVTDQNKGYNYISEVLPDSTPGTSYSFVLTRPNGDRLTGMTQVLAKPVINQISQRRDRDSNYSVFISIKDNDADELNYYRIILNKDSLLTEVEDEYLFEDNIRRNPATKQIEVLTRAKYRVGDTAVVRVFHLPQSYYLFLKSLEQSKQSAGNPFSQPSPVISNIEGGFGIFSSLQGMEVRLPIK